MRRSAIRLGVGVAVAVAALAIGAGPAVADRGAPGTTFPEQPNGNVGTACAAVNTNPGTGVGGHAEAHLSPTAGVILTGLLEDACVGG
jgi:hypothetical protein